MSEEAKMIIVETSFLHDAYTVSVDGDQCLNAYGETAALATEAEAYKYGQKWAVGWRPDPASRPQAEDFDQ